MAALSAWQKCDIAFLSYEVSVRYGNKCKNALSANTLTCHTINAKNGANSLSSLLRCNLWWNYSKQIAVCKSINLTIFLYVFYNFCIFLSALDHVAHVVSSGWFASKVFRCFYSTLGKYSLRICCVLKCNYFIFTCEDYFMFTNDVTTTNSA